MTSPSRARRGAGASPATHIDTKPDRPSLQPRPFRPRRALFVLLMIVFVLWVAGLLTMYFTTVYPSRVSPLPVTERLEVR